MSTLTSMPLLSKISIPVFAVAAVLHVVGFSCPNWFSLSVAGQKSNGGLWKGCVDGVCKTYPTDVAGTLKAAQAFESLGILAIIASVGLFVACVLKPSQLLDRFHSICKVIAGACILIGVIIFGAGAANTSNDGNGVTSFHLDWAFGLCTVASILAIAAGVLGLIGASQTRS